MKPLSEKHQQIAPSLTLSINAKAKALKAEGKDVLSFASGEPDMNTPRHIREKAIERINIGGNGYTAAKGLPELRQVIARKFKADNELDYDPEDIIVSSGAKHSLYNAMQAIVNPGDEIIQIAPYWVSYPELIKMAGATPVTLMTSSESGFLPDEDALEGLIGGNTKAIIINSPNNPTGVVYPEATLRMIGDLAHKHDLYIISDEIYEKLIYEGTHHSIAALDERFKRRTITINGMSKAYAMTGWRIGYAAAFKPVSTIMNAIQSHATSNPNTIAQYASIEGLTGEMEPIETMRRTFDKRRHIMMEGFDAIQGMEYAAPTGAFYLMADISAFIGRTINGKTINSTLDMGEILLDECLIAVVPGEAFGSPSTIRLSYATDEATIREGLSRLQAFAREHL